MGWDPRRDKHKEIKNSARFQSKMEKSAVKLYKLQAFQQRNFTFRKRANRAAI